MRLLARDRRLHKSSGTKKEKKPLTPFQGLLMDYLIVFWKIPTCIKKLLQRDFD